MINDLKTKYVAAGLGTVLFLGVVVWLIRSEGRRTRESIRAAAKEAGGELRKGVVEGGGRVVEKAGELPGQVLPDVKKERPEGTVEDVRQVVKDTTQRREPIAGSLKDLLAGKPKETPIDEPVEKFEAGNKPDPHPVPPAAPQDKSARIPQEPQLTREHTTPDGLPGIPTRTNGQPSKRESGPPLDTAPQPPKGALKRDPSSTATPVGARRAERSGRSKPLEKKQEPGDAIGQLFDLGHKLAKSADEVGQEVLGLSLEEEQQLGSDVHRLICQDQRVVAPPPVVQRLQKLTQPILELRSRKGLTYRFLVLGSPEVNAFAHVGGYVYVTQGMLGFVKTDAELQFILAHEIAHNDLRHVARQMTYAARASEVGGDAVGSVAQMAYMAIALGYSEDKEFEADAWAMRAMLKTGHGRAESLAAIRHLLAYVHEQKLETKRAAPRNAAERTWQQIEDHFNSHPPTEERARRLETLDADGNQG